MSHHLHGINRKGLLKFKQKFYIWGEQLNIKTNGEFTLIGMLTMNGYKHYFKNHPPQAWI